MTLAEINPLGELEDGSFVALDAHMDMENEARGAPEGAAGGARRRRRGDAPGARGDAVRDRRRGGRRAGPPRRRRQRHRVRRQPRARDRRRRRLADALRRGPRARRRARELLRDRRQPVASRRRAGLAKLVLQKPGVDKIAVMMSIVSNTRVDIVARGVIKACLELGYDPAEKIAIFRIPGAWEDEGFKILEKYGVEYADRSVSMHEAARRAVEKIGRPRPDVDPRSTRPRRSSSRASPVARRSTSRASAWTTAPARRSSAA